MGATTEIFSAFIPLMMPLIPPASIFTDTFSLAVPGGSSKDRYIATSVLGGSRVANVSVARRDEVQHPQGSTAFQPVLRAEFEIGQGQIEFIAPFDLGSSHADNIGGFDQTLAGKIIGF